eukprot:CAMPEP_0178809620 /NCGR_PEP_ID=MMETSP0745-20121128/18212_1 /TAXON_ID=913974 /ORGANISM="Nitzschia punctata, Strain CCMP561" /LENGTH=60 /DNA_ID=CAMNT_0020470003 /DNA_START=499 /DNA_END=681 /DNA_ORIENTATION=-
MGTTPEGTEPPPTVETGDEGEAEGGQDPPEGNNGSEFVECVQWAHLHWPYLKQAMQQIHG